MQLRSGKAASGPLVRALRTASLFLFLCALPAGTAAALQQEQSALPEVLDRVRSAIGWEELSSLEHGLLLKASGRAMELDSQFRQLWLPDGQFRLELDSQLNMTKGFDGTRGWLLDFSGMPGHLESLELEVQKLRNWVVGGYWLDPACPVEITLLGEEAGTLSLVVQLVSGGLEGTVEIDAQSALPSRLSWRTLEAENYVAFEDYAEISTGQGSFRFPRRIEESEEHQLTTFFVEEVGPAPASAHSSCKPVTRRPDDTFFDESLPASVAMQCLPGSYLVVRPLVDGEEMGAFLLDTGCGMNVIDTRTADALGMQTLGKFKAVAIGGLVDVRFRKGEALSLGPVEIHGPYFVEIDLAPIGAALGIELAGMLGTDFMNRCLVELDIGAEELKLYEPGVWEARKADWQEITFANNAPCVEGTLSCGLSGLFLIDTGAGTATVAFDDWFIDRETLFGGNPSGRGGSGGAGGAITIFSGSIPSFEMCGRRLEGLGVSLMVSNIDTVRASHAGLIGNAVLSRYVALFDYPRKRMALLDRG